METKNLEVLPQRELVRFCRRWKIRELAVFGSLLRTDFGPESDIDFMVTFEENAEWTLLDHIHMQQELQTLLQRPVDLVTRTAVERSGNRVRRREILNTAFVIYPENEATFEPG